MIGAAIYQLLANGSAFLTGARLVAFNALNDLVGDAVEPMRLHQRDDFPAIFYEQYSNDPSDVKDGPSALDQRSIRLTCYGKTYDEAVQVMGYVRTILDRFSGSAGSVQIQSIQFITDRDLFDDRAQRAGVQHDYKIRHIR